jgi:hypothetical protein
MRWRGFWLNLPYRMLAEGRPGQSDITRDGRGWGTWLE